MGVYSTPANSCRHQHQSRLPVSFSRWLWRRASSREHRLQASIARCHFSHCLDSIADTTSLSRQTMRKVAPHTRWRYRSPILIGPLERGRAQERKKRPAKFAGHFSNNFPAATYSPTPRGCSTIGPEGLSCRVRNGIGRFPHGMTTGKNSQPKSSHVRKQTTINNTRESKMCGQAARPISTG